MGNKLTRRLTIPITPEMDERIRDLAKRQGVRLVDVGRMALVLYLDVHQAKRGEDAKQT